MTHREPSSGGGQPASAAPVPADTDGPAPAWECATLKNVWLHNQALVEQCAAGGKASAVERCVLRLDLATLDFNQACFLYSLGIWTNFSGGSKLIYGDVA